MRYLVLIILNIPIVVAALLGIVTKYKMQKITVGRFRHQLLVWSLIFILLVVSFPVYNYLNGRPPFDSTDLSVFDIVQTTAIILLFYIINDQRQRIDQVEKRAQELHQELSIRLSSSGDK